MNVTDEQMLAAVKAYTAIEGKCRPAAIRAALTAALSAHLEQDPVAWMIPGTDDVATNAELDYRGPEHSKKVRAIYTQPLYAARQPAIFKDKTE